MTIQERIEIIQALTSLLQSVSDHEIKDAITKKALEVIIGFSR